MSHFIVVLHSFFISNLKCCIYKNILRTTCQNDSSMFSPIIDPLMMAGLVLVVVRQIVWPNQPRGRFYNVLQCEWKSYHKYWLKRFTLHKNVKIKNTNYFQFCLYQDARGSHVVKSGLFDRDSGVNRSQANYISNKITFVSMPLGLPIYMCESYVP